MAVRLQVVFDAADPSALAAFWGRLIGYVEEAPPDGFDSWEAWAVANDVPREEWDRYEARVDPDGAGPRLLFQRVPEPKAAKNRVHLDLSVGGGRGTPLEERRRRVAAAAERAVAAGATRLRDHDEAGEQHWVVLQDPEGNEFCLH
jgi:glyoxalase superfamily protein